jgi:hypothetical protein
MNQDLTNELAEVWAQLEAAKTRIERVEAELSKESKPWEPWKPDYMKAFWYCDSDGSASTANWNDGHICAMIRNFNNCFPTKEAAERHSLRLRSMRPTCPVPKVGDEYWVPLCWERGFRAEVWTCREGVAMNSVYLHGRLFTTKEAAEAWIAEFGDAWTTLEDEA